MAKLPPPLREGKIVQDYKIGNTRIMIGDSHLDYSLEARERLIRFFIFFIEKVAFLSIIYYNEKNGGYLM